MTKQRAMLLEIFRSELCIGHHRTAEEILELVRQRMPGISRATVYNNLRSMEDEGFIRRISGEDGADLYDAAYAPHGHMICKKCRAVSDLMMPELLGELCDLTGVDIDSYELKIRYICNDCKASAALN
jgi:Fe2+ or Zn2+ uptake regulation protein